MAKSEIMAQWDVSLDCRCPECHQWVDLLDYSDFWDGKQKLAIIEHDTERADNLEVVCPECNHNFSVCCTY